MKANRFKRNLFIKWWARIALITAAFFMIVILTVIIISMQEGNQGYYEGTVKAVPLLSNDKIKKLGDLYIKLNVEFENEIKEMQMNYANRLNKRGEKIRYGVNGQENDDEISNDDYVNGLENIKYIKGKGQDREDGESNFIDMIAVLSAALGADIDKYSEDELSDIFTSLFKLTHTFTGESTELYPCDHGCAWSKYYCGDNMVIGNVNGGFSGYYNCDEYKGEKKEYGLMYDPFLIERNYNYQYLTELAGNENKMKTEYTYKDVEIIHTESGEIHRIKEIKDRVVCDNDEILLLNEAEGYCEVCSDSIAAFRTTTKKYGGCIECEACHHGTSQHLYADEDDEIGFWADWYIGSDNSICSNCVVENANCNHEHTDACDGEDGCKHECADPVLKDTGYYVCEGHTHYACPGHILVCCYGHTNLNLEIKIVYHEEMIDILKSLIP